MQEQEVSIQSTRLITSDQSQALISVLIFILAFACFTHEDENSFTEIATTLNDRILYNIRAPRFFPKPKMSEDTEHLDSKSIVVSMSRKMKSKSQKIG